MVLLDRQPGPRHARTSRGRGVVPAVRAGLVLTVAGGLTGAVLVGVSTLLSWWG